MWEPERGDTCLGVALSGGPDSLALTLLAQAAFPGRVEAATVDHGLRRGSAEEAREAARICATLGVPHAILTVEVAPGNLQAEARTARYDALGTHFAQQGVLAFATAHHADDQAETLLMRLNRGSGLSGLAGVRPTSALAPRGTSAELAVIRPLLDWRRRELADIVAASGFAAAQDPSNEDEGFDRVRMRKAIAELPWLDPLAIAASARHLAEAEEVIEERIDSVMDTLVWQDGACLFQWGHPRIIEIGVVERILRRLGASDVRRSDIARMVGRLRAKENASLGGILARRVMYQADAATQWDAMRFEPEPPRKSR
ncbi:tRNA lysidine(34) synthetase TilS [Erythrobacter mangrovi]|uniref:tRNA(Ile)-lysidine synthase n=1 Tax=Erythrobacter mangrovi TaxID=2739433 RepID=A0A7D4CPC1_9SPHN|nr:tRNA lysidine(34) synthetase TilS [Erythrobacter mangrovi]